MHYDKGVEIDIVDLIAECVRKRKIIFICLVVACVIGVIFSMVNFYLTTRKIPSEKLKLDMEEEDIKTVDNLYYSYVDYYVYKEKIEREQEALVAFLGNGYVKCTIKYTIASSMLGAGTMLPELALDSSVYDEIEKVMFNGVEKEEIPKIKDLISVYDSENDKLEMEAEDGKLYRVTLSVYITADSVETADKVADIIDNALLQQGRRMEEMDPIYSFAFVGRTYNDDSQHVDTIKETRVRKSNYIEEAVDNLKKIETEINTLPKDCKDYFNALLYENELIFTRKQHVSRIKPVIIVAFLGAAVGFCSVILMYVFKGTINTTGELERYGTPVIGSVISSDKNTVFSRLLKSICYSGAAGTEYLNARMNSDIVNWLKGKDDGRLFIMCSSDSELERETASALADRLKTASETVYTETGCPVSVSEDLDKVAGYRNAVIMVELRKTKRKAFCDCLNICESRGLDCLGVVTVDKVQ